MGELTHLDAAGQASMVDVGDKPATERRARARAVVRVSPETAAAVQAGNAPKGDVIGVARIAGIQAAKRTSDLIPLCHPLSLSYVGVEGSIDVVGARRAQPELRRQRGRLERRRSGPAPPARRRRAAAGSGRGRR